MDMVWGGGQERSAARVQGRASPCWEGCNGRAKPALAKRVVVNNTPLAPRFYPHATALQTRRPAADSLSDSSTPPPEFYRLIRSLPPDCRPTPTFGGMAARLHDGYDLSAFVKELGAVRAPAVNRHDLREGWLRAAAAELKSHFANEGYALPEKIRFAIAFPSTGRKGKRMGECWHSTSSEDEHYEIFLRADLSEPVEILGVLVKELVHTVLPPDAGHGKLFRIAALKIGLQGPMRTAKPGALLRDQLEKLAASLGPLPHATLHIEQTPLIAVAPAATTALDRPKKQRVRMLKATCSDAGCTYIVRVAGRQVREIGPPHCPKHGPMTVELTADDPAHASAGPAGRERLNALPAEP